MTEPVVPPASRREVALAIPDPKRIAPARERGVVATRLRVVVVADELPLRRTLARILAAHGFDVRTCEDGAEAVASIESEPADVMLLDLLIPRLGGAEVLRRTKQIRPEVEVVIMTTGDDVDAAVAAVRAGAYDFVSKPFASPDVVTLAVEKAAERRQLLDRARRLEDAMRSDGQGGEIVGASAAIRQVREQVEGAAQSPSTVLIQGEDGVGREYVARAIHQKGPRAGAPFVTVHCAAIAEGSLENELFGFVRGAFQEANANREGLVETADGGTLFLDEVAVLPASAQARLLRVLQEGETQRIGANDVRRVDIRVIASTAADLRELVSRGTFREELYYRLQVVRIVVPPLRERREDIPLLASQLLDKHTRRLERERKRLSPEALAELERRPWPGNVRELESVIERAAVLSAGEAVRAEDLPAPEAAAAAERVAALPDLTLMPYRDAKAIALRTFEREYVSTLLRRTSGNVTQAARRAELDRSNFRRLIRKCER